MRVINNTKTLLWTMHAKMKMRFYGLSEQRVRRVMNSPKRIEEGVAPKTIAMMQPVSIKIKNSKPIWKQEIWVMIQRINQKPKTKNQKYGNIIKIISAWRYPGQSKPCSEAVSAFIERAYADYIKDETSSF